MERHLSQVIGFRKSGHYTITVKDVISNKRTVKFAIKNKVHYRYCDILETLGSVFCMSDNRKENLFLKGVMYDSGGLP